MSVRVLWVVRLIIIIIFIDCFMLISTHKNKVAIEGTSVTSAESWLNMRDCYMFLQNSPQQCRCGLCMLGNFQTLPQGDQNAAEGILL